MNHACRLLHAVIAICGLPSERNVFGFRDCETMRVSREVDDTHVQIHCDTRPGIEPGSMFPKPWRTGGAGIGHWK